MFAKVPRIITSWLPRRAPYELNSRTSTPCSSRYSPAGPSFLIEPAGEMWSVVTLSPSLASTRAPSMSETGSGSSGMPSKYGGGGTQGGSPAPPQGPPPGPSSPPPPPSPLYNSPSDQRDQCAPAA